MSTKRTAYERTYRQSLDDPDGFWRDVARRLDWMTFPSIVKNTSFLPPVSIRWFEDGVLNACHNCIDRHLPRKADDPALIWEGDDPEESKIITYAELKDDVCRLSNALKSLGVRKGDRVTIYLPMVPEIAVAMLACARIGAVHSVVFGGFSAEALKDRILDCGSAIVLTADEGVRGGKRIPLKDNVDAALTACPGVESVLVLERTGAKTGWVKGRDLRWSETVQAQPSDCPAEPMNAEDPLFILYTSGSTGKPKGVLHTTGGYMVYASYTHEKAFDYKEGDVYWCTADAGWITGHSYIVYGPLANGAASVLFEGVPNYPDWGRFWDIVDKYKVNSFYTAPTAIRSLIKAGDAFLDRSSRESLRILGTVGEPINPEAFAWYRDQVGKGRCAVVDTWWQTETGGHMILPLPDVVEAKPGVAGLPFYGVAPVIVDPSGTELSGVCEGALCIAESWPGQMRTVYNDHARFEQTYFSTFQGLYFTGDGARRDEDGHYRITGRMDDVINVSGHRLGTAEIEAALNTHEAVAESAVVGISHDIKGQGIYAFVTLKEGHSPAVETESALRAQVRKIIGPIATPDAIQWAPALPKTRSGKIMRRILRKIAEGDTGALGDTSTLADPSVVDALVSGRIQNN